ncbi:transposase family protein [Microcoleus sp. AR_TQ3_B6]|uniref:transposase family protein n=1 Tax=Microcoleus sp. AR_TQ3_B6 TaxID=3055284 RepID=UPI00403F7340
MSTDIASPEPTIDSSDSDVTSLAQGLHDCFSLIQDNRSTRTLLHQLSDILTISVLAVIAGGNGWEDMALYGLSKYDCCQHFCLYLMVFLALILFVVFLLEFVPTNSSNVWNYSNPKS